MFDRLSVHAAGVAGALLASMFVPSMAQGPVGDLPVELRGGQYDAVTRYGGKGLTVSAGHHDTAVVTVFGALRGTGPVPPVVAFKPSGGDAGADQVASRSTGLGRAENELLFGLEADVLEAARGRIGLPLAGYLPYLTAGIAGGGQAALVEKPDRALRLGTVAGVGIERSFTDKLSGRVEYLYGQLPSSIERPSDDFHVGHATLIWQFHGP